MSSVSLKQSDSLCHAIEALHKLQRYGRKGVPKPHKLVLLLAVVDLYGDGLVFDIGISFCRTPTPYRIYLNKELERRFRFYFSMVAGVKDWCQIGPPFYHLRTSGFWLHKVHPSRTLSYQSMSTPGGNIFRNVEYAYLSDYTVNVMTNEEQRRSLREAIIELLVRESSNPQAYRLRTVRYKNESNERV